MFQGNMLPGMGDVRLVIKYVYDINCTNSKSQSEPAEGLHNFQVYLDLDLNVQNQTALSSLRGVLWCHLLANHV